MIGVSLPLQKMIATLDYAFDRGYYQRRIDLNRCMNLPVKGIAIPL
jgi:hypothetical protein